MTPHTDERARGVNRIIMVRKRLRTVDFNQALKLQKKGHTLREISDILMLPYRLVADDLYWDVRK